MEVVDVMQKLGTILAGMTKAPPALSQKERAERAERMSTLITQHSADYITIQVVINMSIHHRPRCIILVINDSLVDDALKPCIE